MKILITGATSGIGQQLAYDYLASGHHVIAIGRNQSALEALKQRGADTAALDLNDRQQVLDWFAQQPAPLDLAILNAGVCEYVDLPHFDSALVARVMQTNVIATATVIEAALPLLKRANSPQLAVVGSSAAYLPLPRAEAYGASKAALAYMMKTLAIDLRDDNITLSLVCPGFVKTPLTDKNTFPMPFRISVEDASQRIRTGLEKRHTEIHFPKRLTWLLKALSLLPHNWWVKLSPGAAH